MVNDKNVHPKIRAFVRQTTDFTIDRYSSKGGFGQLYFGYRNTIKDRVALKFYEINANINPHEEAQILRAIKHDNILEIFDAKIINNDFAYFVTPEISGGDLQNYSEQNIIDVDTALSITNGILEGLAELHKSPNNLVHRDLKPQNILIDNNSKIPFISDFGSVKKLPNGVDSVSASIYSFFHRPKEAMENDTYFKQSDIYQVGIILYQILGGHFPIDNVIDFLDDKKKVKYFQLSSSDQIVFFENQIRDLISKGKIINFHSLPIYIDDKLRKIIKKATDFNYENRYENCAIFIRDLFNYRKTSKNFWIDNNILYSVNNKKTKYYRIFKHKSTWILEQSKDNLNYRRKSIDNDIHKILEYIKND